MKHWSPAVMKRSAVETSERGNRQIIRSRFAWSQQPLLGTNAYGAGTNSMRAVWTDGGACGVMSPRNSQSWRFEDDANASRR